MYRYFLQLSYKGTHFHGWQYQENALTVQEELEKALSTLLKEEIKTTGAGRTDTGVHASYYIAHFDSVNENIHLQSNFIYKLNQLIHPDIAIQKVIKVKNDAHARFDAISREYKYYISTVKDPFNREFCFEYFGHLDFERMNESAAILFDYDDFKSFCKLHSDVKTTICRIFESKWEKKDNTIIYTIKADRFLRNMVRAIVGTMFEIGRNKTSVEQFHEIIQGRDRCLAGASVPSKGLFLNYIEYSNDIFTG